jgi:hypothetical protein
MNKPNSASPARTALTSDSVSCENHKSNSCCPARKLYSARGAIDARPGMYGLPTSRTAMASPRASDRCIPGPATIPQGACRGLRLASPA